MSYINLNLKPCKVPSQFNGLSGLSEQSSEVSSDGISWYNLDTNRRITKMNGKVGLIDPAVAASNWSIISEFIELNDIHPDCIKYMKEENRQDLIDAMEERLSPHISMIEANNVDDVPDDVLRSLDIFSFSRISTRAKVLNVVDGDTIDVAIILNPKELCISHWSRRDKKMIYTQSAQICGDNSAYKSTMNVREFRERKINEGILMKLRLRLYGIDTAEKETIPGQRCKEWSILKYNELNNIVYVTLMGTDARGRTLANVYECSDANRSINQLLIEHIDPIYGKLCVPYYGETKDVNFTSRTEGSTKDPNEKDVCLTSHECFDPNVNTSRNMDAWHSLSTSPSASLDAKTLEPDKISKIKQQASKNFKPVDTKISSRQQVARKSTNGTSEDSTGLAGAISGSDSTSDNHIQYKSSGKEENNSTDKGKSDKNHTHKRKLDERCVIS
jgi:endonuclease YncB( thermonuclease family)